MRVLIVGNMGYIGPVLARHLRQLYPDYELVGIDTGFFGQCLTDTGVLPERALDRQIFGDVRTMDLSILEGVDAVVQLAAISNDPMGKKFEKPTDAINRGAAVRFAEAARDAGVKNFVFASSCSVYGVAGGCPDETAPVAPMTAYAHSKIDTERQVEHLAGDMGITCLRFATACGMSPRLRLDLVLNDFVSSALTERKITVLSDGTPWRPLIDVHDMSRAIDWAIHRQPAERPFLVCNAGRSANNWQVKELAEAVVAALPGTDLSINTDAPADSRSYKVDFTLFEGLAPNHVPELSLEASIDRLVRGMTAFGIDKIANEREHFIRLKVLERYLTEGTLSTDLSWTDGTSTITTAAA